MNKIKNKGRIYKLFDDKKYGFINDDELGIVFFHISEFKSDTLAKPLINISVLYDIVKVPKGFNAKNITVDLDNLYENKYLSKFIGGVSYINMLHQTGIIYDRNNRRYLFNFNDVIGNNKICRNQKVNFYPIVDDNGKDAAIFIKIIKENKQLINVDNSELHEVIRDWKIEARASIEELKYFYYMNEIDLIKNHDKCYVIGRKGTGKTAMAEYIYSQNSESVFTAKISLKNYPFINKILEGYTDRSLPNDYINVWKFIIFSAILKMMSDNEKIDGRLRSTLKKIYPDDSIESLERIMNPKMNSETQLELLSYIKVNSKKDIAEDQNVLISYFEKSEIFERCVVDYYDGSSYVILIDGLDDEYNNVKNKESYYVLLAGLFKAVQEIKYNFQRPNYNISPIIFLRDDLYRLICQADKAKWDDFKVTIGWSRAKIQEMIAHRISKSINPDLLYNFDDSWNKLFPEKDILTVYGYQKLFSYVENRTFNRPRDYIQFIKICCERAHDKKKKYIDEDLITECLGTFSDSIRSEIENEIKPEMNFIDEALHCIRLIGRSKFNLSDYCKMFKYQQEKGKIPNNVTAEQCLDTLFIFNLIGNVTRYNKTIFVYQNASIRFSPFEDIIVHRALRASLGVE